METENEDPPIHPAINGVIDHYFTLYAEDQHYVEDLMFKLNEVLNKVDSKNAERE